MRHENEVFGTQELCAWQVRTGFYWIQSRLPIFTRLLEKRKSARLVTRGVAGGYLRTYEVEIGHRACHRLVKRWLERLKPPTLPKGEGFGTKGGMDKGERTKNSETV